MALLLVVVGGSYLLLRPRAPRAQFAPESLDFGERRLGVAAEPLEVEVTNGGERPMVVERIEVGGDSASEFSLAEEDCSGRPVAAGGSCRAGIGFAPALLGARAAELELHGELAGSPARLVLAGTGIAPLLEFDRARIDFASQRVGTSSGGEELRVTNSGTAPLRVERVGVAGDDAADFLARRDRCSKAALAPGEDCSVSWVFAPRAAGPRSARVVLDSDAAGEAEPVVLAGEGIWMGAAMEVEPGEVDFGEQRLGQRSAPRAVRVLNRQEETLGGIDVRLEGGGGFSIVEDGCRGARLDAGDGCQVSLAFQAAGEGDSAAVLEILHPGADERRVRLVGRGVAPRVVLSTAALDFGTARVEGEPIARVFELANRGSAAQRIEPLRLRGADDGAFARARDDCSGRDLAPGRQCRVEVTFRPGREGSHRATLGIEPPPAEGGTEVALAGAGVAPRLALDVEALDFGSVRRTTSGRVVVTARNAGTTDLVLRGVALAGDPGGAFRILPGGCGEVERLAPGAGCTLELLFSPVEEGRVTARLRWDHDGLSGPREVPLAGLGLPPPQPEIRFEPAALDFGTQPVGERSAIRTLVLRNPGTGRLELRRMEVVGENPADFVLVPATCDAVPHLVAGSDCSTGIRFVPGASGERRARLVVHHNAPGGTTAVPLVGRGLASQAEN